MESLNLYEDFNRLRKVFSRYWKSFIIFQFFGMVAALLFFIRVEPYYEKSFQVELGVYPLISGGNSTRWSYLEHPIYMKRRLEKLSHPEGVDSFSVGLVWRSYTELDKVNLRFGYTNNSSLESIASFIEDHLVSPHRELLTKKKAILSKLLQNSDVQDVFDNYVKTLAEQGQKSFIPSKNSENYDRLGKFNIGYNLHNMKWRLQALELVVDKFRYRMSQVMSQSETRVRPKHIYFLISLLLSFSSWVGFVLIKQFRLKSDIN